MTSTRKCAERSAQAAVHRWLCWRLRRVRMACLPSRQLMPERFNHAATNGQPSRLITGVVHAVPLVLEVRTLGVEQFAPPLASLSTHLSRQPGELGNHVVSPTGLVSENDPQACILCMAHDRLLAVVCRHRGAEMLAGVSMVNDLRGVLVDGPVEVAPVFLGPIGQRYHLQVWPYGKNRSQLCIKLFRQRLLLGLWRSPVPHGVESLGVLVIERDGAAPHLPVACGATELLGQSLLLGGLTFGLGLALGILVRDHHAIQGHGDHRRLGWNDFLLPKRILPELAVTFPDSAQ